MCQKQEKSFLLWTFVVFFFVSPCSTSSAVAFAADLEPPRHCRRSIRCYHVINTIIYSKYAFHTLLLHAIFVFGIILNSREDGNLIRVEKPHGNGAMLYVGVVNQQTIFAEVYNTWY